MAPAVDAATALVAIVKVALEEPAGTVTEAGELAAGLAFARATAIPPAGALAFRVTLPVEAPQPPATVTGVRVRPERTGGLTVIAAVLLTPRYDAVRLTVVAAA